MRCLFPRCALTLYSQSDTLPHDRQRFEAERDSVIVDDGLL